MSDQDGPADPPHEEPPTEPEDAPSKPKEPPTVDEWIEKQRQGYTRHSSFQPKSLYTLSLTSLGHRLFHEPMPVPYTAACAHRS